MNDWSRLAVDPDDAKTRAEEGTAKYKYAPDKAVQGAPIRKRELPRAPWGGAVRSRVASGNFTPRRSQIPDVNLSIHPARATE
jgi:hypothetical protein